MRGIKPFKAGFLSRPFEWQRKYHLGISALLYFPFEPRGTLLTDLELWDFAAKALPPGAVLDMGIPKSRSEMLVVGGAYQPGGRPAPACVTKAEIGAIKKTLFVMGDREWRDDVPTEPQPFVHMPITWANAFGGAKFDRNPLGKGAAPIEIEGRRVHPLPNVEAPGKLVTSPREKPEPQSFLPIDFVWPQRFSLAGTYDKAWFDELYPGFAADMDYRIWNAAPPDQQKEHAFRGDERMFFKNMHPARADLEAHLPGMRCRAFIVREGADELEEIALSLTTVWAFPDQERGVVVFQGACQVREDDAHDVSVLMIAVERLNEPRSMSDYRAAYEKRIDPERVAETLDESDLVPRDQVGFGPEVARQLELTTAKGLRADRLRALADDEIAKTRAELEALGLDPDEHGPKPLPKDEPPPGPAELARIVEEKRVEAERAREDAQRRRDESLEALRPVYEERGLDFEELKREVHETPGGPPEPRADKTRDNVLSLANEMEAKGHPIDELRYYVEDPSFYQQWKEADEAALQSYRENAHLQGPARVDRERAALARRSVEKAIEAGEPLSGRDLTGADLSELSLRGVDLSRALLECASLRGADLSDANLEGAVLARVDLTDAKIDRARFAGANLGKARLVGTTCEGGADFTGAVLGGAMFERARLTHVKLDQASLVEATFVDTDLSHSTARELVFHKSSLRGVKLTGVVWSTIVFHECDAEEIDLSGCTLRETSFVGWKSPRANFVNADLRNARFVLGCVLDGSDMKGANLEASTLRGVSLKGVDLSGATLTRADLSEAILEEAKLYRAVAREALLVRADLRRAQLVSADLFQAVLQKADVRGADLRGANLYGADFALIHGDQDTRVEDAIMDKVRARPRRPEAK